jgi:tetratricopeptide (TPR) repeat protein
MPDTPENAIFICYRREDSQPAAYNVYDRLKVAFGERSVALDHFYFKGGDEWRQETETLLQQARAVVVVINKDWVTIGKDRLIKPDDPVRRELELALANENVVVIPVTIDRTRSPGSAEADAFRAAGHHDLANLLARLFAKSAIKVRFDRDFEPDIQQLIRRLDEVPEIDQVGAATSFDVGGLQVVRPWDMTSQRPAPRPNDPKASDLWILQPKYRATVLVGRDGDLAGLRNWLDGEPRVAARLLVGRAGAGKTRIGFEFIWEVSRQPGHLWDAGVVVGESLRQSRDWNAWVWRRPTLLMLDYAHALEESVARWFLALARKAHDRNLPPLRLLMMEREASATEGWFHRLLELESSTGGGPVRELFEPAEPVSLHALDTPELRRAVLTDTLMLAAQHDGRAAPAVPEPGASTAFDRGLLDPQWSDPLYLMMAALVGREAAAASTHGAAAASAAAAGAGLVAPMLQALSLGRTDLAMELAKHERRRLDHFVPTSGPEPAKRLFRHLAACATLCGGLTADGARQAAEQETDALRLVWPGGPGDLATLLHEALPADDHAVAAIQPDIVAEAFILETFRHEGLSQNQQRAAVIRSAGRNAAVVVATLFHAFQNFAADDQRTAALLDWIDTLIGLGLSDNPGWLLAIESALPHQTTVLREAAARVTERLYRDLRKLHATEAAAELSNEVARLANNLSVRLSELGRRADALEPAQEAVALYRELATRNPDAFRPDLASSLNNLANRLSELGRRADALEPAQEAVAIRRELATRNPDAFRPDLAMSLGMMGQILEANEQPDAAWASFREGIELLTPQFQAVPAAFAPLMAGLVRDYLRVAGKLGCEPDLNLVAPVLERFQSLKETG